MRSLWKIGLMLWYVGLLLASNGSAFVLTGTDWSYQSIPMGEFWTACGTGMPGSGVQRTKEGAAEWNYAHFIFVFETDACLSGGAYPSFNNVNQVDFGGGLGAGVLAVTASWFSTSNRADTLECDMRFSNSFSWYTGTGTPPGTQFDWWSVAAHEMGHCLGLGHESQITNPKPVMYPSFEAGEVRRTLTPDDIAGRNAIYGSDQIPPPTPNVWTLVPGGGATPSSPAATVWNDNLGLFVRGTDSRLYVNWLLTNNQWTGWGLVPGGGFSPSSPAAAVWNGNLGLFVRGTDSRLYVNWLLTNNQWTGWGLVPGGGFSPSSPAAAVWNGNLGLFVQGTDNRLYVNWLLTNGQWTGWGFVPGGGFSPSSPAAAVLNGNLGLFVRGTDSRLYVNWLLTNGQWTGWGLVPGGGFSPSSPAAAVLNGNLGLFVRGTDSRIYVNWLHTNNQWTGWAFAPGGGFTPSSPAATGLDDEIALFVQGTDNRLYVNFLTGP